MSIALEHPPRKHHISMVAVFATLGVAALMTLGAVQWSGGISSNDQPSAPADRTSVDGPNSDLAPDWTARRAVVRTDLPALGPNSDLATQWTERAAAATSSGAAEAADVGSAPDRISQHAATVAGGRSLSDGPNVDLAPSWTSRPVKGTSAGPNADLPAAWTDN